MVAAQRWPVNPGMAGTNGSAGGLVQVLLQAPAGDVAIEAPLVDQLQHEFKRFRFHCEQTLQVEIRRFLLKRRTQVAQSCGFIAIRIALDVFRYTFYRVGHITLSTMKTKRRRMTAAKS
jgi:hypothetical protein